MTHFLVKGLDDSDGAERIDVNDLKCPLIINLSQIAPTAIRNACVVDQ